MAERLLQAMGLGLVVGASVHACGSGSDDIGESGGGGAGGDGPSTTGAGACTPTSVVGGGVFTETVCLDVCPPAGQEDAAIAAQLEAECCADGSYGVCRSLTSVVCGPFAYWGPCCWETRQAAESCDPCLLAGPPCGPDNTCPGGQPCSPGSCCGTEGRPLRIEGEPVTARAVGDGSWPRKARPDVSQLSADDRRELASHWEKQALDEHAASTYAREDGGGPGPAIAAAPGGGAGEGEGDAEDGWQAFGGEISTEQKDAAAGAKDSGGDEGDDELLPPAMAA